MINLEHCIFNWGGVTHYFLFIPRDLADMDVLILLEVSVKS